MKIDAQDKDMNTALHLAVKANNLRMVILLVDAGANPRLANAQGKTAMDLTDWFSLKDRKIRSVLKQSLKR